MPTFDKLKGSQIDASKFERTQIRFLATFSVGRAIVVRS